MSHNVNLQHIVFRTRHSGYAIPADDRKRQLLAYLNSESQRLGVDVLRINAHLNHIHILADVGASLTIADYVKTIKANSSRVFRACPIINVKREATYFGADFVLQARERSELRD